MVTLPSPFSFPEEDEPALYAAIGALAVAWGVLENSLNITIALIYHDIGGRAENKLLPFVLKDKLAFVRRCMMAIAVLKPYRKRWLRLANRISTHNSVRVAIIHGYLSGFDDATKRFAFTKLDGGQEIHTLSQITITLPELAQEGAEIIDIGSELNAAMTELFAAFDRGD